MCILYRAAKNGTARIATYCGCPVLYADETDSVGPMAFPEDAVLRAVERHGGFQRGWCRFEDCWVVNEEGRSSATFLWTAQIGNCCKDIEEDTFLQTMRPGRSLSRCLPRTIDDILNDGIIFSL